ncbi:Helix-hairpin-helix DNA-binding motif-containing protein [Pseudomonas syringae pv. cilantro]|uniref:Helix-hairpin-helix DNA-binding motif-containing protein n=2 Tax=Pseudomonas syringae group TaxID=136849 RepID=A0A0N0XD11_PSESX|nr:MULTISPECIES: helix-turn-helix transcriptional regulator [Pseudomonas syringae group]KPC36809.1 Helix-hairpin-helix DNA-binding motif-containing protein [Pseudomonas syringae pv. cilantro]KPW81717.1 Helix-hairpin-helix DNA-binding motif-containing protein [Pseudomonas syringae pv. coriandricola]RMN15152.1 Helix-hairpin-helix DNA-binding motif-containing protein [Pseudomonas syringae pv. coriandricola]
MDIQVISHDGEPQYAVLPWDQYQALLKAAGLADKSHLQTAGATSGSGATTATTELPGFDQLGALRKAKGLEVATLARTVGISPSYLELIENGTRQPDSAIKRSLAWELGVPGWRGEP